MCFNSKSAWHLIWDLQMRDMFHGNSASVVPFEVSLTSRCNVFCCSSTEMREHIEPRRSEKAAWRVQLTWSIFPGCLVDSLPWACAHRSLPLWASAKHMRCHAKRPRKRRELCLVAELREVTDITYRSWNCYQWDLLPTVSCGTKRAYLLLLARVTHSWVSVVTHESSGTKSTLLRRMTAGTAGGAAIRYVFGKL